MEKSLISPTDFPSVCFAWKKRFSTPNEYFLLLLQKSKKERQIFEKIFSKQKSENKTGLFKVNQNNLTAKDEIH
ncbi:MAG: hypothetical protein LBE91_19785 [Tannerella sp.]|nr:hypothetical protein [Tannerella sp.]